MTRCTCAVAGCKNTSYDNQNLKFFKIPKDPAGALRWLKLIGRHGAKVTKDHHVCEDHFTDDCFLSVASKTLSKNALPCANLPATSVDCLMVHRSTQVYKPIEPALKTIKKRESVTNVKNQKETFEELCDKYLSDNIAVIVKAHADFKRRFDDGHNADDFKFFCLKLYYVSPESYAGLQKTLNLPDGKSIVRLIGLSIASNHESVYKTLKARVDCMTDLEKNCTLLIGYVEVKPHIFYHIRDDKVYGFCESQGHQNPDPAAIGIVLIVRGIYEPWTLAVDYALFPVNDDVIHDPEISSWIHKCITELLLIGLRIRICISNLSSDIIVTSAKPNPAPLNIEKPFFFIENKQIYYAIDPTLTIKKIYNCFIEYEFHFQNTVAKWQDIVEFYNRDSKKKLRLAPKLSEEQVRCSSGHDIPYSYVINTLSETVAAGMSAYIEFGVMGTSALGTVRFLTVMSNLIDFTHSCQYQHHREYKRPFEGSEAQISFIMETLTYFRHLRLYKNFVDVTDTVGFIKDLQIAIKSLLMLSEDFKIEKYPNLFTTNINFNIMSTFFKFVSRKNSKTGAVLPWRLITEFRKMFFRKLLHMPEHRYSPEALKGIFSEYFSDTTSRKEVVRANQFRKPFQASWLNLRVRISDYKDMILPSKGQMKAIGAFLLNKCLEKHTQCTLPGRHDYLQYRDPSSRYPEYTLDTVTKTWTPDKYFMLYVWELEQELKCYLNTFYFLNVFFFAKLEHRTNPTAESFKPPCLCFPSTLLRKLFFRLRLSQILKANNKAFKKQNEVLIFEHKDLIN